MWEGNQGDAWSRWQALQSVPELLEEVSASTESELRLQQQLRRRFDAALVRDALQLVDSRRRASVRFTRGEEMWFDSVGLQQATSEAVATHKADRFEGLVQDLCCGIGGDALALARRGPVIAVDRDPGRALCCRWNAQIYQAAERLQVLVGDVREVCVKTDLVHVDPDQRVGPGGRRSHRVQDAMPGMDFLEALQKEMAGGAIKLSPAANFLGRFPDCEIELVSLKGECKQAIVWFGDLATARPQDQRQLFRATVLPDVATLSGHPLTSPLRVEAPGDYLFDPDPAVVRAGLVDVLAEAHGLWRLDESEENLGGSERIETPFARCFQIEAVTPQRIPAIREAARAANLGPLEIKCRHVPIDAEAMRKKLKLDGSEAGVILVVRIDGRTRAVVARRSD